MNSAGDQRQGAAGRWRSAFLRMPYYRDYLVARGMIVDTFESAVTWSLFPEFYETVRTRMQAAIREATGNETRLSCRFTHVYPDGPAPYFSFSVQGPNGGAPDGLLPAWRQIKAAANEAVVEAGGTITHHHAVGRDHRPGYERQSPALFRAALQGAKARLDPAGLLNPGVLVDPAGRDVGQRGVMGARCRTK
jgi:alkyldihydroxyacetonephosphate synthase